MGKPMDGSSGNVTSLWLYGSHRCVHISSLSSMIAHNEESFYLFKNKTIFCIRAGHLLKFYKLNIEKSILIKRLFKNVFLCSSLFMHVQGRCRGLKCFYLNETELIWTWLKLYKLMVINLTVGRLKYWLGKN